MEPLFPALLSTDLRFPPVFQSSLADYFSHCVAREPLDLRSHVRRIFLAHEHGSTVDLFGALVDLFIALGKKGLNLRKRMLELSKGKLQSHEYGQLRDALIGGLDELGITFVPGAMLCRGVEGAMALVESSIKKPIAVRDPLMEAREYLEYSQLDEARNVLEYAVMQEPGRSELHKELLDIYRSTRDRDSFARMFQKLDGESNPMRKEWRELAEFLRSLNV
jgi:hypothetical protein